MRILCNLALPLAACGLVCAVPAFGQKPPVKAPDNPAVARLIHSLGQVESIEETNLSRNSKWIVWVEAGHEGNGIELATMKDPSSPRKITACANGASGEESDAVFSPNSKEMAFFSTCTGNHQPGIFVADVSGNSAPKLLVQLDGYARSLQWSPNGKQLSFLYVKGATRQPSPLAPENVPEGVIGVQGIQDMRVANVDVATRKLGWLTPSSLYVYEFDWSPDSSKIAYVAAPPPGENNWWVAKLYTEAVGGTPQAILDPKTIPGSLHGLQIAVPRWSPDGENIAFIGGLMSDQGSTGGDIYLIPASGGQPVDVTPGRPATPQWFEWLNGDTLRVVETRGGSAHLFDYELGERQESPKDNLTFPASIGAGELEMRVSTAKNGEVAFIESSFAKPPEVWAGKLSALQQITNVNEGLKPVWGKAKSIDWTNEGFNVQGWLLLPADYNPAKRYPMVVYIHGGPSAANMSRWPWAGYGPAPFSAMNYFVLMPNPRGSFGQGEKFAEANRKDFGHGDLRDILAGITAVEKQYPVDDNRVGITGWSYGGYMTMFAITQTHRFRAAVSGAGLSDWLSYYGENSIDQWMIPFFGASVYDDPAVYAKSSPINFVRNVKTPTLMVVGDRDGECPAPQSFEFWHALHDLGVTTELVVYPNEGHGFEKPKDRINVLERAIGWFNEYMPAAQ